MSDELKYTAIILTALSICLFFVAVIVAIRNKGSLIETKDADFIDRWIKRKRKDLSARADGMKLGAYMTMLVLAPLVIGTAAWLLSKNSLVTFALAGLALFLPEMYVKMTENKQKQLFSERYLRAVKQLATSLRAGETISQAVDDVCANPFLHQSIISEFEQISADIRVGISIMDAFQRMADRIEDDDVADVAMTVALINEAGGSEADAIELIAKGIERRLTFQKEMKSIFAGSNTTVIGIDVITYAIAVMTLSSGGNDNFYSSSPLNLVLVVGLVVFMIIGSVVSFRMVHKATGRRK